jgi:hypothetical protein
VTETIELRHVRTSDFIAERLEYEADQMPPSYKDKADLLRAQANILRIDKSERMIWVREKYL